MKSKVNSEELTGESNDTNRAQVRQELLYPFAQLIIAISGCLQRMVCGAHHLQIVDGSLCCAFLPRLDGHLNSVFRSQGKAGYRNNRMLRYRVKSKPLGDRCQQERGFHHRE